MACKCLVVGYSSVWMEVAISEVERGRVGLNSVGGIETVWVDISSVAEYAHSRVLTVLVSLQTSAFSASLVEQPS